MHVNRNLLEFLDYSLHWDTRYAFELIYLVLSVTTEDSCIEVLCFVSGILKKSTSSAFEGIEDEDCCNSQCSCSDSGSCSCSDHEQAPAPTDTRPHDNPEVEQEIPPPLEFDTNMYSKRFETSVEVEVNACHQVSPTESEDMKYCATEADQFYKQFTPQYGKPVHISSTQHGGGDSATDSAIDMPGDGSVSTINEIPPHHSTAISSSIFKHTPTVADYSDMQLPGLSPAESRSRVLRTPRYVKPPPPNSTKKEVKPSNNAGTHPVIYEYNRSPTNRSAVERHDSQRQQTFKSANHSRESHNISNHNSDESVTV